MKKVTFHCDGPDPMKEMIDDPTLEATKPAPLLTASWADCLLGFVLKSSNDNGGKRVQAALQALADGRTACVRVMSEDEWAAWFAERIKVDSVFARRTSFENVLDIARAMGAVR